jgi:hypothetical protein
MKFFCYIFSLYFLALSIVPCTDIHAMNGSESAELASFSTDSHENCPHENGSDFCSPFCVCSCCGQNFTTFQTGFSAANRSQPQRENQFLLFPKLAERIPPFHFPPSPSLNFNKKKSGAASPHPAKRRWLRHRPFGYFVQFKLTFNA